MIFFLYPLLANIFDSVVHPLPRLAHPIFSFIARSALTAGIDSGDSLSSFTNSLDSELNLFIRFIFGLAIVLILLILTLWFLKHIMRFRGSDGVAGSIDVLDMRYIEQKKAIVLIRVLKRVLIVGIAENSIAVLGELSPEEIGSLNLDKKIEPRAFGNILTKILGKKGTVK